MKKFKRIILLFITIIFTLSIIGCTNFTKATAANTTDVKTLSSMVVNFIDVGQGDSALIQVNNRNMIIDTGTTESADNLVKYLKDKGIAQIDYLIVTHPHEDHIGGATTILKNFEVKNFYSPKITSNTKTFENMIRELQNKNLKINTLKGGVDPGIDLGENTKLEIFTPNKEQYEDLNNYSPIIKITYGDNSFIFTGDAETESEKEALSLGKNLKADVLKVGHHGSSSSTSKELLNAVNPSIAIISVGKDNKYGHPTKSTLNKLNKKNIKVYRTDLEGTITLISDGKNITKKD